MFRSRAFVCVTLADLIVRSAYQMGKTPLLPIYALALGAGDAYLGFIVSVSTLTGMVLKPLIGSLSDRSGRQLWLWIGTGMFALMPLAYGWVQTPAQLFWVRLLHGTSTAIYGPVTLAYVAEQSSRSVAERLGWFGMARSAGYVIGPAVAGVLLLRLDPVQVFALIGGVSSLAFLPIALLPGGRSLGRSLDRPQVKVPILKIRSWAETWIRSLVGSMGKAPASLWISGGISAGLYIATYALKTFLPIHGLSVGISVALIGVFFSVQEAIHLITKPWGGRLGDRYGYREMIGAGLGVLGIALLGLTQVQAAGMLVGLSVLIGLAESLILPSALAVVGTHVDPKQLGVSMGWIGMMNNAGKVVGPVVAGILIQSLSFSAAFILIGCVLSLIGAGIGCSAWSRSVQIWRSSVGGD